MNIQLSVAKVEFGGNTGEGQYFYAFSPQTVIIKKDHSPIQIEFTQSTAANFEMISLLSSDGQASFTSPVYSKGNRHMELKTNNPGQRLINVSVVVKDNSTGQLINCDPQVLNDPDPDI